MSTTLPIDRRPLGRSELAVRRVALGCGNFGGVGSAPELFGQGLDRAEAFALMDAAWERGLDHFDTADAYGGGRSEQMIGAWMRSRGVRPMLTTKTFNPMDAGGDHGLAPERIARQLESSRERLGVDCERAQVAYLAFSPLAGGWLTGKYRRGAAFPPGSRMTQRPEPYAAFLSDHTFDRLDRLDALARREGRSMAGLALAWLLADARVTQVVVGPGRPAHLAPVQEALERPLSVAEREEVGRC